VGIGEVFFRRNSRIVLNQAIEYVEGLARAAGDDARAKDGVLIGDVRIDGQRPIVVAEVTRVEGANERAPLDSKTLSV